MAKRFGGAKRNQRQTAWQKRRAAAKKKGAVLEEGPARAAASAQVAEGRDLAGPAARSPAPKPPVRPMLRGSRVPQTDEEVALGQRKKPTPQEKVGDIQSEIDRLRAFTEGVRGGRTGGGRIPGFSHGGSVLAKGQGRALRGVKPTKIS